jgi:hypothetical protein
MGCCYSRSVAEKNDAEVEATVRNMTNHYTVHYPMHEERKASTIYNKTRKALKHTPCFVCGATEHVEIHHFYVEKAMENSVDWEKFAQFAKTCHHFQTGEFIGDKFDWEAVAMTPDIFVDSPFNMVTLCKKHHTSKLGIHHVPFPEWISQKFAREGIVVLSA